MNRIGSQSARASALGDPRGATLVEYLVVVGAVGLVALVGFRVFGKTVDSKIRCLGSAVTDGGSCRSSKPAPDTETLVQSGTAAGVSSSTSGTSSGTTASTASPSGASSSAAAQAPPELPPSGGVGAPSPGTSIPEPSPPAWQPPQPTGAGHGVESAGLSARLTKMRAGIGAHTLSETESRHLLHYLDNTGTPLEENVNAMLHDISRFNEHVDYEERHAAYLAVEAAKRQGATAPMTFPISTEWKDFGKGPGDNSGPEGYERTDFSRAVGPFQYDVTGQVTVYPPANPVSPWSYETTTHVNVRGAYGGSSDALANLHREGIAQNYVLTGKSDERKQRDNAPWKW